ncbi:hypothetical protein [Rhodococcus sp. KBW08]|uniref:hypothetical protein n=1 Tax=Rhodococcus sp. KBW08 TaxID=2144188 RepID=UPI000F5A3C53|nr:hypothetical protein [Rhodococcus sp. KBW08]
MTGMGGGVGSEPKALDSGTPTVPVIVSDADPQGPHPTQRAGRKPRIGRPTTKEGPIAFRPRPGTRAQLEKRAGEQSLSVVVAAAVDAYLGRKAREVDPKLRAALAAELAPIGDQLAAIATQESAIGNNLNQQARFLNTYRELPYSYGDELAALNNRHEEVLAELRAIRAALESLVTDR